MNQSIKSRIAPTPSGFLHIGNAYNFLVTYREAVVKRQGKLHLRIDDSDSSRLREEYLSDIFESLEWLQIPYESGPRNIEDFNNNYSQTLKKDRYFNFLKKVPDTFVCQCSRTFLKENTCPCKDSDLSYTPQQNAIRLKVSNPEIFKEMGDFVLWKKDDSPSYQLASLVDDIDEQINLIVRGEDLVLSTKAQFMLAELVGDKIFTSASFLHHPTIKASDGSKISKSQGEKNIGPQILKEWRKAGKTRVDLIKCFGFKDWDEFLNS